MDPESELISLICQMAANRESKGLNPRSKLISFISLVAKSISQVKSLDLDLDSQPHPKPEVISLISQMISVSSSTSLSEYESELISHVTRIITLSSSVDPDAEPELAFHISQLNSHLRCMPSGTEPSSLFTRVFSVVDYMYWGSEPEAEGELISLFPQLEVRLVGGKFCVVDNFVWKREEQGKCCNPGSRKAVRLTTGAEITHFFCQNCRGKNHGDCDYKAPLEVKHPLHPRHSLRLVLWRLGKYKSRKCYCCDEDLIPIFYYCCACDCAMNIACVEKAPVLSLHHPKWHEHTLALFPRQALLPCNLCGFADSDCAFYICPPCEFVAHQRCFNLPSVIKISRHLHRISFTPSFFQGCHRSCGICRKKMRNDYGGYSCIHDHCSYSAHSECATQTNVWDGKELEGKPEEIDDDDGVEPFLRISNGSIQHFCHQQHHLRLDENTDRDYDENKLCQACITPIYFGNFYSCMQCDFILHQECANHSRKIHHPIHPHLLTLVNVASDRINIESSCSACPWLCRAGFFYKCGKEGCNFMLHVQCATISEPLVHESHMHPLYLTSKPGEMRGCSVCKDSGPVCPETFNCIECDFALCFKCATTPHKVRYKYDKHMFSLSYGEETSTMTYWCEGCERQINPKGRFYMSDESSVTLHISCLTGNDYYMKPGLLLIHSTGVKIDVLRNNHTMSRPICKLCKQRCPFGIVFQWSGLIYCSKFCLHWFLDIRDQIA